MRRCFRHPGGQSLILSLSVAGILILGSTRLVLCADDAAPVGNLPAAIAAADPDTFGIRVSQDDRNHWAFRPIVRPEMPVPAIQSEWVENPIDAFILQKLQAKGLSPSGPAEPRAWLRRVTLDLIGLPPTPEQMADFLLDPSPEGRGRAVDRLLADPGYGVRWGRRWLDVVRYADTNGYERDGAKPHAWRYRDYVIDSLNADKPFDRFLTEQLAGDEVPNANAETLIATTFLRLGTWDDEPADVMVDRYEQLDDVVGTVSATFLGMTLRCARCHNHKFEPLSQIDYSRMLAMFEPLKRPQEGRIEFDVPVGTREEVSEGKAVQDRYDTALRGVDDQVKALVARAREKFLQTDQSQVAPQALVAHRLPEAQRTPEQKKLVKDTQKQLDEEVVKALNPEEARQHAGFLAAIAALKAAAPTPLPRGYIWEEPGGALPVTQVLKRGNPQAPAGAVGPGFPTVLADSHIDLCAPTADDRTSLRRLSLARWMTDTKNPLTARVIVNRLWQGHFGNGLVPTENDFGVMGATPTHPELLDWLASEMRSPSIVSGAESAAEVPWSLKRIHRLIVLSRTYGQSSTVREDMAKVDVENTLLWRFPYRRLDAEAVRDSVLAVSGQLNPQMGGPGIYPKIAREVLEGQSRPGEGWGRFDEPQASRRAAYIFVKRSLLVPEMELLDFADTAASCEQRPVSTIPTQALTLLNGEFLNRQSELFADRLSSEAGEERGARIDRAYQLAFSRLPSGDERAAALAFLERQAQQVAQDDQEAEERRDPQRTALAAFCLVLYNLNEFAYVD